MGEYYGNTSPSKEYEASKRLEYEDLLRVADALSDLSEGSNGTDDERAKADRRETRTRRKEAGRVRRIRHHSKDDLYFRKKERKRCIEAEKRRGEHSRIRQALFIRSEKDLGRFVEDRKGDLGNVAFERLHQQDVPLYKKQKCSPLRRHRKRKDVSRTERHISHWLLRDEPSYSLVERIADEPVTFIPLQYNVDAITESKDDILGDLYKKEEYCTRRIAELNKRTQDDPHNDALWLEYARFQMDAARVMESNGHKIHMDSVRSKMYSILEKGIEYNPRSGSLAVELLKIAESLKLPKDELKSLWSRFLLGPGGIHSCVELWLNFLEKQKNTTKDDFDALDCSRCYIMAIRALKNQWYSVDSGDAQKQYIETHIAALLTESIKCHLESGMIEHGITLFQCFLEFNFFCPEEGCIPPGKSLEDMFVEFFDSSSPMIGSAEATGWSQYEIQKDKPAADTDIWCSITPFSLGAQKRKDVLALSRIPADPVGGDDVHLQVGIASFTDSERNLERKIISTQEAKSEKHDMTFRHIKHAVFKFRDRSLLFSVLATSLEYFGIYHPVFMQKHNAVPFDMRFSQTANNFSCFNLYYSTECMQPYQHQNRIDGQHTGIWCYESLERIDFVCRVLNDLSGKIEGVLGNILDAISVWILQEHSSSDKALTHAKMILSQRPESLSLWGEFANASLRNPDGIKMMKKVYKKCMTSSPTSDIWHSAELCKHMIQSQLFLDGFQWTCPGFDLIYPACAIYLSKERAMAALSIFFWFAQVDVSVGREDAIVQARKIFQSLISMIPSEYKVGNHMSRYIAILSTFAAFEIGVSIVEDSPGNGLTRACNIVQHAMAKLEERNCFECKYPTVEDPYSYQYLVYKRNILASLASDVNPHTLAPSTVKDFILNSDAWNSPLILKSFVFHQLKGHGPQMLRRELHLLAIKSAKVNKSVSSSREPSHFHIACTLLALDIQQHTMLEVPVIWRMRIQEAAESQQPKEVLVRICQEAVNSCPWSKSLWMLLIENSCQISLQAAMNALSDMRMKNLRIRSSI